MFVELVCMQDWGSKDHTDSSCCHICVILIMGGEGVMKDLAVCQCPVLFQAERNEPELDGGSSKI